VAPALEPRRPRDSPLYIAFDLLRLESKDYGPEPLKVRRKALETLVKGQSLILPARRLSPNGFAAWTEVIHRGWKGMVGKDPGVTLRGRTFPQVAQGEDTEVPRGGAGILQTVTDATA
jgi:ATP-dependent DNA ligase